MSVVHQINQTCGTIVVARKKKRKLVGHLMISVIDKEIKKLRENKNIVRALLKYKPQS